MAPDQPSVVQALQRFYRDAGLRAAFGRLGRACAIEPTFDWDVLATTFDEQVRGALAGDGAAAAAAPVLEGPTVPAAPTPKLVRTKTGFVPIARPA